VLQLDDGQIVDGTSRWRWLTYAGLALLVMTGLLWATKSLWLGVDPAPVAPQPRVVLPNPKQPARHYFALRATKMRASKTTEADNVVQTVGRGEDLQGVIETGLDGKTMWLNTGEAGPYVAALNLAEQAPPPLDLALDLVLETETAVTLYDRPGDDDIGVSSETVPAGTALHISGVVGNWFEITPRHGGVAYFKPTSKAEKKAMAKAMAVLDDGPGDEGE
jgi:hypothetical protein